MKIVSYLIWIIVSLLFALSFAVVTGVLNPQEKVSAIWIVIAAATFYVIAYRFYGAFLSAKVMVLNEATLTPAYRLNDGRNFYPTNKWVLFGHHFAAIAGAGPLIGPVLATQFGYLPGFLWILIGAAVAGGVHDFTVLVASMRRGGKSLAHIAREEVGTVVGGATMIALLFIIIVTIAGLGLAVINSLFFNPWGTFIIAMTIPIAMGMGIAMRTTSPNKIGVISVVGFTLLIMTVILGKKIVTLPLMSLFNLDRNTLTILLALYGFAASVLPVWLLLAPRDYLSSFMKIGVVILLALGVLMVSPDLQMEPLTRFSQGGGPIIPGKLFPFLFITIACGAISGFHSLISTGTTPKMIERESHARAIGYGAMLVEGFVAMIALIASSVLIPGDYFAINTKLSFLEIEALGFPVSTIEELSRMVGVNLAGRPGGAVSLAAGMSYILSSLPLLKNVMSYWYQFALMFEALFILTTIDAGTRVARYIVQELGARFYTPFGDLSSFWGNSIASFLVVFAWGYFVSTGSISIIWPMFGTGNQLLSMLALCIVTTLLIKGKKVKYIWTTMIPMVFMVTTTFTASLVLIKDFGTKALHSPDSFTYGICAFCVGVMFILAAVVLIDSLIRWYGYVIKKNLLLPPR
jgi:carbon starvation protein